jgi:hypothetical protein
LARRKIEEFARSRGAARATVEVARRAYDSFRGESGGGAQADAADQMPPAALVERLESEAEALANGDGFRTRHYRVRPCAGAVGCPRSLIPVRQTAEALAQAIGDAGLPAFLEQGLAGRPILSHHRFQAAVSGCPNARPWAFKRRPRREVVSTIASVRLGARAPSRFLRRLRKGVRFVVSAQSRHLPFRRRCDILTW